MSTILRFALLISVLGRMIAGTSTGYTIQTVAGGESIGDNGPGVQALLQTVEGVTADRLGFYYFADTDSHRIRRMSPSGTIVTIAGTGKPGYSGDGGLALNAQLNLPYGLTVDQSGNLYIADFGNQCVRHVSPSGAITTIATGFLGPRNLATDVAGNLYISDFSANRVYKRTPQGVLIAIAGMAPGALEFGDNGVATQTRLNGPAGVSIDLNGNLWIADSGNRKVRRVTPAGAISTLNVSLATPVGLAATMSNELYIADAGAGQLVKVAQISAETPTVTRYAQFCRDVAADYAGNLLLSYHNTVQVLKGTAFSILAGGHDYFLAGDESAAINARLHDPEALAFDRSGSLYIADAANQRIRRVLADGTIHSFVSSGLTSPQALAFDEIGNLYIADAAAHAIFIASPTGKLTSLVFNGKGFEGDGGLASGAQLNTPTALAYDPSTRTLYIADQGNGRIRAVTLNDGRISTIALLKRPAGLAIHPKTGILYASDGSTVWNLATGKPVSTAGVWTNPTGLAFDSEGNLFVADSGGHRVTRIATDGVITLLAGTGTKGFSGDGGNAVLATLDAPSSIAVDPKGNIYLSDSGNNRVRLLIPSAGNSSDLTSTVPLQLLSVMNAASRFIGPIAAGEWITIAGVGVDAMAIQIGTTFAERVYSRPGEITVAVPRNVPQVGTIDVVAFSGGSVPQARVTASLAPAALGIFAAAILNEDGLPNTPDSPASRGSVLTVIGTGEGNNGVIPTPVFDSQQLQALSFQPILGTIPGVFALTVQIPNGFFPVGPHGLKLVTGSSSSQNGISVFVR